MKPQKEQMEINEDIVIVGAGIAGLATSLALHRMGLRSLVLESSDSLRTSGFALVLWTNAWRALDALGVGDTLRKRSLQFSRYLNFFWGFMKCYIAYINCAKLKLRSPLNKMRDNIVKRNTCLVGDALHPMTLDIGQGGCSALEDSVILARCIADTFSRKLPTGMEKLEDDEFYNRTKVGLEKYAKERRWRIFILISTSYLVGLAQESNGKVISYLKEKFLAQFTIETIVYPRITIEFICGFKNLWSNLIQSEKSDLI
nr:monooxygenase 3-like [Nicotiana tomentosiformis]